MEGATISVAYAYITSSTPRDDIEFYKSRLYTPRQAEEYIDRMVERARNGAVTIVEVIILDGGHEIWRGKV